MSYNNNWLKTLSESYKQNTHLQEELNEQVALNKKLLFVIEELCEELGIDVEELLNEENKPGKDKNKRYEEWAARHTQRSYDSDAEWTAAHNRYRKRLGLKPYPNTDPGRRGN